MMVTGHTALHLERLITTQGVLTLLGLVTGIAAILLPVGFVLGPKDLNVIGVLSSVVDLVDALASGSYYEHSLFSTLLVAPLLLAIPISAGYLRWVLTGGLTPWAWRTAYALAVLGAAWVLLYIGWSVYIGIRDAASVVLYVLASLSLSVGVWLVMRNRRLSLPHTLNALIALQVVYVVYTGMLLVFFIPESGMMFASGWDIGALPALLTVVAYVVQIVLGSLRKGASEH